MKFSDSRGIKTGQWLANEILRSDDINFLNQCGYQNALDALRLKARQETKDEVITGLELTYSTSRTFNLQPGAALSFTGRYFTTDVWGFTANVGDAFMVLVPAVQAVGFDAGGTYDRVDIVEARPIQSSYNNVSRQFKDPVTGLITSALMNTRLEYGYEFQIKKGSEGPIRPESWTWTIQSGTTGANLKNKYILFSTHLDDYYIWFNTDGTGTDPLVSGRTGIPIACASADTYTSIAFLIVSVVGGTLTTTELQISSKGTGDIICIDPVYTNVTDATNGDVGALFAAISITQGNGPQMHTAGWIKLCEVFVAAGAATLSQSVMKDYRNSSEWYGEAGITMNYSNIVGVASSISAVGDRIPSKVRRFPFQSTYVDHEGLPYWDEYDADVLYSGSEYGIRGPGRDGFVTAKHTMLKMHGDSQFSIGFRLRLDSLPASAKTLLDMYGEMILFEDSEVGYASNNYLVNAWGSTTPTLTMSIKQDDTHIIGFRVVGTTLTVERAAVSGLTVTFSGSPNTIAVQNATDIDAAMLTSSTFVVFYNTTTQMECVIGTLSGDTISWGTAAAVVGSLTGNQMNLAKLSDSSFVVQYYNSSTTFLETKAATISAGTITFGTAVTINGSHPMGSTPAANVGLCCHMAALDNGTTIHAYCYGGLSMRARVCTISGTTVTAGSEYTLYSSNIPYRIMIFAMSPTQAVLAFNDEDLNCLRFITVTLASPGTTALTVYRDTFAGPLPVSWNATSAYFQCGAPISATEFMLFGYKDYCICSVDSNNRVRFLTNNTSPLAGMVNQGTPKLMPVLGSDSIVTLLRNGANNPVAVVYRIPRMRMTLTVDSTNFTLTVSQLAGTVSQSTTRTAAAGVSNIFIRWEGARARLGVNGSVGTLTFSTVDPDDQTYNRSSHLSLYLPWAESAFLSDLVVDELGLISQTRYTLHHLKQRVWSDRDIATDIVTQPVYGGAVEVPVLDEPGYLVSASVERSLIEVNPRSVRSFVAEEDIRRGRFVFDWGGKVRNRLALDTKRIKLLRSQIISTSGLGNWAYTSFLQAEPRLDSNQVVYFGYRDYTTPFNLKTKLVQMPKKGISYLLPSTAGEVDSAMDVSSYYDGLMLRLGDGILASAQSDNSDNDAYTAGFISTSVGARGTTEAAITSYYSFACRLTKWNAQSSSGGFRWVHIYTTSGGLVRARVVRQTGSTITYVGAATTIYTGSGSYALSGVCQVSSNTFMALLPSVPGSATFIVCTVDASDVITSLGTYTLTGTDWTSQYRPGLATVWYKGASYQILVYLPTDSLSSFKDRLVGKILKWDGANLNAGDPFTVMTNAGAATEFALRRPIQIPLTEQVLCTRLESYPVGLRASLLNLDLDNMTARLAGEAPTMLAGAEAYCPPSFYSPYEMVVPHTLVLESTQVRMPAMSVYEFSAVPVGIALDNARAGENVRVQTQGVVEVHRPLVAGRVYFPGYFGDVLESHPDRTEPALKAINTKEGILLG